MLNIVIQRKEEYDNVKKNENDKNAETSTVGNLSVYNEKGENIFSCFTLENKGESTSESGQDKRILAGVYYLRWTSSSTNSGLAIKYDYWKKANHLEKIKDGTQGKNIAVWVMSDTIKNHNKRRILIHIGNSPQDTLGCILCGYINGNNGKIGNSTKAINDLFLLFEKYGIENFKLTIKEI
ncbi:DUF5675 family protein [Brachyspira pilosicoli]